MTDFNWTETTYAAQPKEFRMVKGSPMNVEQKVNEYISKGFVLHGPIMEYTIPSTTTMIFVQAVVLYENEK